MVFTLMLRYVEDGPCAWVWTCCQIVMLGRGICHGISSFPGAFSSQTACVCVCVLAIMARHAMFYDSMLSKRHDINMRHGACRSASRSQHMPNKPSKLSTQVSVIKLFLPWRGAFKVCSRVRVHHIMFGSVLLLQPPKKDDVSFAGRPC